MLKKKIVDNRVFLLGLDAFFREGMKVYESGELLELAQEIVQELKVDVHDCPIEGYYSETAELTEYFRLIRTLQACDEGRAQDVQSAGGLRRLRQVCGSRVYGEPTRVGMLSVGKDPVAFALDVLKPDWELGEIVRLAKEKSISSDDYSLVGLAARCGDPVIIAATRETVVLHAMILTAAFVEEKEYIWRVDDDLARLAGRFTATVKKDIGFVIPAPSAENCEAYYHSATGDIIGRCVRLGYNDAVRPTVHYHWAIRIIDGEYEVDEFWDEKLWTTEMYREQRELQIEGPEIDDSTKPRCKRDGCDSPVTKFSLLCKKHHWETLRRLSPN